MFEDDIAATNKVCRTSQHTFGIVRGVGFLIDYSHAATRFQDANSVAACVGQRSPPRLVIVECFCKGDASLIWPV